MSKRRAAEALKVRNPKNANLEIVKTSFHEKPKDGKKAFRQRLDGTLMQKKSVELDRDLVKALGMFCAEKERTERSVIEEGVRYILSQG